MICTTCWLRSSGAGKLKCAACGERGATVGCGEKRCSKSFHLRCAAAHGLLQGETTFHCRKHATWPDAVRDRASSGGPGTVWKSRALVRHRRDVCFRSCVCAKTDATLSPDDEAGQPNSLVDFHTGLEDRGSDDGPARAFADKATGTAS